MHPMSRCKTSIAFCYYTYKIFDFSFFPEVPQRQGLPFAASVESFYEQVEAPPAETEGSHIALSAEGKGVRILKSERAASPTPEEAKPRRGKGEKPSLKKDAVVVIDFSFDPEARDREEIVKGLYRFCSGLEGVKTGIFLRSSLKTRRSVERT